MLTSTLEAGMLITGDTLFLKNVGRTDLPGPGPCIPSHGLGLGV